MKTRFTAIVEGDVLRPTTSIDLADGTSVELVLVGPAPRFEEAKSPAEILAAIAALPSAPVDPLTSTRHDEVLCSREAHS
jgi:hypothetical protein